MDGRNGCLSKIATTRHLGKGGKKSLARLGSGGTTAATIARLGVVDLADDVVQVGGEVVAGLVRVLPREGDGPALDLELVHLPAAEQVHELLVVLADVAFLHPFHEFVDAVVDSLQVVLPPRVDGSGFSEVLRD